MSERNYDFRKRHWAYHKPDRRDPARKEKKNEILITNEWKIGCSGDKDSIALIAVKDFQEYLFTSMGVSIALTDAPGDKVIWVEVSKKVKKGFVVEVDKNSVTLTAAEDKMTFKG